MKRAIDQVGGHPLPRFYATLALALSGLFSWIYYPRWWFILLGMAFGFRQAKAWWKVNQAEAQKKALEKWILSFFERLMNFLDAGYNPLESWARAGAALQGEGGEEKEGFLSGLDREVKDRLTENVLDVIKKYKEGQSFEDALVSFGQEVSSPLVENFIHHFILGIRQGGDLAKLTESFYRLLFDRRELDRDRETKLYAAKRELAVLFVMPFILLASLRYSSLGQGGRGLINLLIHLFCLGLFYLAWLWARSILHRTEVNQEKRSS